MKRAQDPTPIRAIAHSLWRASCTLLTGMDGFSNLIVLVPAIGLAIGLAYFATQGELKRRRDRVIRHQRRLEEERRAHAPHTVPTYHHGDDAHDHEH